MKIARRTLLVGLTASAGAAACASLPRKARELRLASFNIWHDMGDWTARLPLIVETLRAADADVIGLQEVLEDTAKTLPNQAQTIADALGGYRVVFVSTDPEGAPRRYGNAVLTRLPVLEQDWKRLEPLDDYRTAVRVRLDFHGRALDLVNTHFHHTAEGGPIRARQAADLLAWIGRGETPLIVMGDFNAPLSDAGLADFTGDRFFSALPADAAVTTLNPAKGHDLRVIDHIFVERERFTLGRAYIAGYTPLNGEYPSDHFAVVASVSLR